MNLESKDKKEFVIDNKCILQTEITMPSQLVECGGEFVIPDYMPVIQKVLRVEAVALPPTCYRGGTSTQMSGDVLHTLVYIGEDGETGATVLPSRYELSVKNDECAPLGINARVEVEGLTYRITAPRKLNIRTRLDAKPYCICGVDVSMSVQPPSAKINKLYGECDSIKTIFLNSTDAEVADSISVGNKEARLVWCGATAAVIDAKTIDGGVSVRGEVLAKVLTDGDGGMKMHTKRIPFDEFLEGEARRGDAANASASVVSCEASKDGGEVSLEISLYVFAMVDSAVKVPLLKDAFSTEVESKNEYKNVKALKLVKSVSGLYTVGASVPKSSLSVPQSATAIDTSGKAVIREISAADGNFNLGGVCELSTIFEFDGEYVGSNYSVPFNLTIDCDSVNNVTTTATSQLVNARVRTEGENLVCDMDIALALRAVCQSEETVLASADFSGEKCVKENYPLCLVYPNGESLWNIAKKYKVSPSHLAKLNNLDIEESEYSNNEALSNVNLLILELK